MIYFRIIFERRELASVQWSAMDQSAVIMALILSQIIFYLLFPVSVQVLHPAGLNLSLLSSNFITLAVCTAIFMYKVGLCHHNYSPFKLCMASNTIMYIRCGERWCKQHKSNNFYDQHLFSNKLWLFTRRMGLTYFKKLNNSHFKLNFL